MKTTQRKIWSKVLVTVSSILLAAVMQITYPQEALGQEPKVKPNYIPPQTKSQWISDGDNMYNANIGNVGVGTAEPAYQLDIMSQINVIARFGSIAMDDSQVLINAPSGYSSNLVFQQGDLHQWYLGNRASNNRFSIMAATSMAELFSIQQDGKVGIGTAGPNYRLDVQGGPVNATGGFCIAGDCKTAWSQVGGSQWANFGSNISFNTGNVGIGTASPGSKLDVSGTINATGFTLNGGPFTGSQWTTSGANINRGTGNVGIGTASPAAGLDIQNPLTAAPTAYGVRLQQALTAGPNNSELNGLFINPSFVDGQAVGVRHNALVTSGGNIGIGTSVTNAGLDVQNPGIAAAGNTFGTRFQQQLPPAGNNAVSTAVYINPDFNDGQTFGVRHNALVTSAGNVGIGISVTNAGLDVQNAGVAASGATFGTRLQQALPAAGNNTVSTALYVNPAFSDGQAFGVRHNGLVVAAGDVGIGTSTPAAKLDVVGSMVASGNMNVAGTITGGNIVAKYQDMAEWVESSQELSAGTVVVLDQAKTNQVVASSQVYDTRVAGVISARPGIVLGENGKGKVLVATTGRVTVKVDASSGPIQVGDLLVTGDKQGVAMKSQPINIGGIQLHRPGTLIGKALEPLAKGQGEILVLLSLQ